MKTWVVRAGDQHWIGNAESAIEAVQYAIAKAGIVADTYTVIDWDANVTIVDRVVKAPADTL